MKKIIAILVAVSMLVAFSAFTAFAAVIEELDGSDSADVTVNVQDANPQPQPEIDPVYYVDVAWETLEFTYVWTSTDGSSVSWNPETHTYQGENGEDANGAWDNDVIADAIVVTNHSDANINAFAKFSNDATVSDAVNGVTAEVSCDGDMVELASAAVVAYGDYDAAESGSFDVSVDGQPGITSAFTVDTITVTISNPDL